MSTCAMIQPPKMSPFWFASAGIGITRSAGTFPSGSFSTRLYIVKRPAAERGEARAEDEPGVGEVGVGDHAVGDRGLRLAQVRIDERIDERLVIAVRLSFHGFSVLPTVNPLPGFLAQLAE